jgi:hypothetical protein
MVLKMADKINGYDVNETDKGALLIQSPAINAREVEAPQGPCMVVNGAWYTDNYPNLIITELADSSLKMFYLTPLRKIGEADLKPYKGYHPRRMKGYPLPEYLYRFYGLERNQESLSEVVRVRLSPTEKERLEAAAKNEGLTVSEFLRDQIRKM